MFSKRLHIYRFLLSQFSTEQKLKLHGLLHEEVLQQFANGTIKMDKYVLGDILTLVKEMKFNKKMVLVQSNTNSGDAGEQSAEDAAMNALNGKLFDQVLKKHVQENVVPVIIELKRVLEKQKSPVLKQLMDYLQSLMSDYKSEINGMPVCIFLKLLEILAADKQLKLELEFDMRKKEMEDTRKRRSNGKSPFRSPLQVVSPSNGNVTRKSISAQLATPHKKSPFETPKSGPRLKNATPASQKKQHEEEEIRRTLF